MVDLRSNNFRKIINSWNETKATSFCSINIFFPQQQNRKGFRSRLHSKANFFNALFKRNHSRNLTQFRLISLENKLNKGILISEIGRIPSRKVSVCTSFNLSFTVFVYTSDSQPLLRRPQGSNTGLL